MPCAMLGPRRSPPPRSTSVGTQRACLQGRLTGTAWVLSRSACPVRCLARGPAACGAPRAGRWALRCRTCKQGKGWRVRADESGQATSARRPWIACNRSAACRHAWSTHYWERGRHVHTVKGDRSASEARTQKRHNTRAKQLWAQIPAQPASYSSQPAATQPAAAAT